MAVPDAHTGEQAKDRQAELTKPPGALGQLEQLAIHLAALQGSARPQLEHITIAVFAGDHGVASEGVSAFPQAVTAEMIKNFATGGAAISVLARNLGARLAVINLGTATDTGELPGVRNCSLGPGTANLARQPAMTDAQVERALSTGRETADHAAQDGAQLFIGGEMGIANTTAATALLCALLEASPTAVVGPGSGLEPAGISHKTKVIQAALKLHRSHTPLHALQCLAGFEIAALTGAYLACAQRGLPALVDGFISSVAALVATRLNPGVREWLLFSHRSAEPGHGAALDALNAGPLLDLGMRLGEGSGAAVAVPVLRMACQLHNQMATFDEANVSGSDHEA